MTLGQFINAEIALNKLYNYEHLPIKAQFYLSVVKPQLDNYTVSFQTARNALLRKYGTSDNDIDFIIPPDNVDAYQKELSSLETEQLDFAFDANKITLCIESVGKTDESLPPDKRLGFNAHDWIAIQKIIKVIETEEG